MIALTNNECDLLRAAAGVGINGGKPTRRNLSLYLSDKNPAEVARLTGAGYLEEVNAGRVSTWFITPCGIELGEANGWWPR